MSTSDPEHLNNHQRDTLLQIFQHPTSHNVEWQAVLSLLEAAGSVELRHDGKYLGPRRRSNAVLVRAEHEDIDVQQVVDLRRMMTGIGFGALVEELEAKGKEI